LDTAFVAVAQLAQESHAAAQRTMQRAREQWLELILEEVGEEATAHAILLLGDGLILDAALSGDLSTAGADRPAAGAGAFPAARRAAEQADPARRQHRGGTAGAAAGADIAPPGSRPTRRPGLSGR